MSFDAEKRAEISRRMKESYARRGRELEEWVAKGSPAVPLEVMVAWVLAALNVPRPVGCPCPQARSLLAWAKRHREKFYDKYVPMLTKVKKAEEAPSESSTKLLDEMLAGRKE